MGGSSGSSREVSGEPPTTALTSLVHVFTACFPLCSRSLFTTLLPSLECALLKSSDSVLFLVNGNIWNSTGVYLMKRQIDK